MRIVTKLINNVNKKQTTISEKPDSALVKEVSSNDGIKFDKEGIPYEYTLDIHQITKRSFTATNIYNDPPAYPWAEASKHKKIKQESVQTCTSVELMIPTPQGNEILVYNGYPIRFVVNNEYVIAINNRGDSIFEINGTYILRGVQMDQIIGTFVEVLDCNVYTKETILTQQQVLWYV